jgi:hypothetical protein
MEHPISHSIREEQNEGNGLRGSSPQYQQPSMSELMPAWGKQAPTP